jgi:hypothetical protein
VQPAGEAAAVVVGGADLRDAPAPQNDGLRGGGERVGDDAAVVDRHRGDERAVELGAEQLAGGDGGRVAAGDAVDRPAVRDAIEPADRQMRAVARDPRAEACGRGLAPVGGGVSPPAPAAAIEAGGEASLGALGAKLLGALRRHVLNQGDHLGVLSLDCSPPKLRLRNPLHIGLSGRLAAPDPLPEAADPLVAAGRSEQY